MDMLCPECMGSLVPLDGQTVVCSIHGGRYQVLFARHPLVAPAPIPAAPLPRGVGSPMNTGDDLYALAAAAQTPPTYQYVTQTMTGVFCTTHPTAPAICYCQTCRAPVCGTCVFNFPGGIQLCPSCASNPRPKVSRHRKGLIAWSIAMAAVSILSLVVMVILVRQSHTKSDIEAMSMAIVFFSFMPAIVGLALGVGTYDRRLSMPALAWVGIIGNGLIVLVWLIAIVAGAMR